MLIKDFDIHNNAKNINKVVNKLTDLIEESSHVRNTSRVGHLTTTNTLVSKPKVTRQEIINNKKKTIIINELLASVAEKKKKRF